MHIFIIIYIIGMISTPIIMKYKQDKDCGTKENILLYFTLDFLPYTLFLMIIFPISIPIILFVNDY
jgi:hypothetical protein